MAGKHSKSGFDLKIGTALTIVFVIFTALVKIIDVKPIGPLGSKIGFASLNGAVFNAFGTSTRWYGIAEGIGYAALLVCAWFGLQGLIQLIQRRSFAKVDTRLYVLAALYIVTIGLYVLFDLVALNYRPVLMEGQLEASYPSSHTLLAIVVFVSAAIERQRFSNKSGISFTGIVCAVLAILCVVARLLSGVHWLTDIIGSVILAFALISFYMEGLNRFCKEK